MAGTRSPSFQHRPAFTGKRVSITQSLSLAMQGPQTAACSRVARVPLFKAPSQAQAAVLQLGPVSTGNGRQWETERHRRFVEQADAEQRILAAVFLRNCLDEGDCLGDGGRVRLPSLLLPKRCAMLVPAQALHSLMRSIASLRVQNTGDASMQRKAGTDMRASKTTGLAFLDPSSLVGCQTHNGLQTCKAPARCMGRPSRRLGLEPRDPYRNMCVAS